MTLNIRIELDNVAFGDNDHARGVEVSRLLRRAAARFEDDGVGPCTELSLRDTNGNKVLTTDVE